jgi:hypothetical protein
MIAYEKITPNDGFGDFYANLSGPSQNADKQFRKCCPPVWPFGFGWMGLLASLTKSRRPDPNPNFRKKRGIDQLKIDLMTLTNLAAKALQSAPINFPCQIDVPQT